MAADRAIVPAGPNDLFLVGDAHQRIYGHKVALRNCGINIQGRSSRLRINYRTTEQIRAWAMAVLHGVESTTSTGERGRDGLQVAADRPESRGPALRLQAEEQEYVGGSDEGTLGQRPAEDVCLVARTNKLLRDDYQPMLNGPGDRLTLLDKTAEGGGVRLATMHRVKGLEFPVMVLAGVNAGHAAPVPGLEGDPVAKADHEERERSLLFVAATRARDLLIVTALGHAEPLPADGGGGGDRGSDTT